jgi:hypothetical protein
VDVVVLDLDRNHAELYGIAQEIQRLKPAIPAIVVAKAVSQGLSERSDGVVAPDSDPRILLKSLTVSLPDEICLPLGLIPTVLDLLAETA